MTLPRDAAGQPSGHPTPPRPITAPLGAPVPEARPASRRIPKPSPPPAPAPRLAPSRDLFPTLRPEEPEREPTLRLADEPPLDLVPLPPEPEKPRAKTGRVKTARVKTARVTTARVSATSRRRPEVAAAPPARTIEIVLCSCLATCALGVFLATRGSSEPAREPRVTPAATAPAPRVGSAEPVAPAPVEPPARPVESPRAEAPRKGPATARADEPERDRRLFAGRTALAESTLERALEAEKEGDAKTALDLLDDAEQLGIPKSRLAEARARLRGRAGKDAAVDEALAKAAALAEKHDHEGAVRAAESARAAAAEVGRAAAIDEAVARSRAAKERRALDELLDEAQRSLDRREVLAAQVVLERARALAPADERLRIVARRAERMAAALVDLAWVDVDPAKGEGIYVRKKLVSNREYRAWVDTAPPGKRRFVPLPPRGSSGLDVDAPVARVPTDEAEAFAASRGERLPTQAEVAAIRRALDASAGEGEVVDGTFANGFRTVRDAP